MVEKAEVSGLVFDVFDQDSMPLKDISIAFNDSTIVSDEQGTFNLGNLEIGEYEVNFYSEFHEPFDTSFQVTDTTNIELSVQLEPIYYDFAPLSTGTEWTYELRANSKSWSVTGGDNSSAYETQSTLKVFIESTNENENEFVYSINLLREGYYSETSNSDSTTTFFSSTGSYKVLEDKLTGILSSVDHKQEGYWGGGTFYLTPYINEYDYVVAVSQNNSCCGWDYITFRRYFPSSRLPGQKLFSLHSGFTQSQDSGLVLFEESYGGHTGSGSSSQKLISISKGN